MKLFKKMKPESGFSLVEVLTTFIILSIVMVGVTKIVITTMDAQQKIDADFRAQQDVRQAEFDLEKTLAEAKRLDTVTNQYPVFQNDLISVPTQKGNWVTYCYTTPPGAYGPTIVRIITASKPTIPPTVLSTDKQLIVVKPNANDQYTTVERLNGGPIFTYYQSDGTSITLTNGTSASTPRDVRAIKINYLITVSEGHVLKEPVQASAIINLRNY